MSKQTPKNVKAVVYWQGTAVGRFQVVRRAASFLRRKNNDVSGYTVYFIQPPKLQKMNGQEFVKFCNKKA